MTKEEAIKHLHTYSSTNGSGLTTQDQHEEAKKMAIKALETQPGWIPIGVPMNSGQHYLVTLRQKFEGEETYRVRIMRLHEGHWLYPHHFPEWINDEMEQEVVAWMPLPKPWEGELHE